MTDTDMLWLHIFHKKKLRHDASKSSLSFLTVFGSTFYFSLMSSQMFNIFSHLETSWTSKFRRIQSNLVIVNYCVIFYSFWEYIFLLFDVKWNAQTFHAIFKLHGLRTCRKILPISNIGMNVLKILKTFYSATLAYIHLDLNRHLPRMHLCRYT